MQIVGGRIARRGRGHVQARRPDDCECEKVIHSIDAGDYEIFVGKVAATHRFREGKALFNASGRHEFVI